MSELIEMTILSYLVHLVSGIIIFIYNNKFLQLKSEYNQLIKFTILYTSSQIFLNYFTDILYPYNNFANVLPNMIIIFILQVIFFKKNYPKQFFIILSFTAGYEILRFLASPLAYAIYELWSPFYMWFFNDYLVNHITINENIINTIKIVNRFINLIIIFACRAVQLATLSAYLYIISKYFPAQDYKLNLNESMFLIFPCITVICIDITVRLMAVSVDNGAVNLIYSRVPETTFLLPLTSLLLLGIVITAVILFRSFIQFKDEEQKRLLLENRVAEVHHEIEELSNVYDDMRSLKHDLRSHISNIAAYVRQFSNNDDLNNYLNQMTQTVEKLDFFYKTGNPIVDIILHQSLQNARKKNIRFNADFNCPKNFIVDIYDLSIILNNALQNALEAAEKTANAEIYIRSYFKGNFYFIEVTNNFNGEIIYNESDLPATTKSDKYLHGLGLTNIRRCAQKYSGDLDIDVINNKFTLTVMLQLKKT